MLLLIYQFIVISFVSIGNKIFQGISTKKCTKMKNEFETYKLVKIQ